jgi:hypothetical protein
MPPAEPSTLEHLGLFLLVLGFVVAMMASGQLKSANRDMRRRSIRRGFYRSGSAAEAFEREGQALRRSFGAGFGLLGVATVLLMSGAVLFVKPRPEFRTGPDCDAAVASGLIPDLRISIGVGVAIAIGIERIDLAMAVSLWIPIPIATPTPSAPSSPSLKSMAVRLRLGTPSWRLCRPRPVCDDRGLAAHRHRWRGHQDAVNLRSCVSDVEGHAVEREHRRAFVAEVLVEPMRHRLIQRRDNLDLILVVLKRVLRSVNHGENVDAVRLDVVDEPIRAAEHLSDLIDIVFRHPPTRQRECPDLL